MQTKKEYVAPMTSVVAAYTASLMAASGQKQQNLVSIYDTPSQDSDNTSLGFGTTTSGDKLHLESKGNSNAWDSWDE